MPANLPPEYHAIEKELRTARTPAEKIDIYERLIAVIPHHKGTDKLIAMYRAKIAKAREEMQRRPTTARRGPGHRVDKSGAGQIVLVGPPNAGKSLLVARLTGADVDVAAYPFTTRQASPYMMPFENIRIQLVDAPPVSPDYMETWFPELVKAADAVLFTADLGDPDAAAVSEGIAGRLRERKVELTSGGAEIPPERVPFLKRALLAANKRDLPGAAEAFADLRVLLEDWPLAKLAVSATSGEGLEELRRALFDLLKVIRVYSKIPGKKAETEAPFVLRRGTTVMELAKAVHKDFSEKLNYARVWNGHGLDGLRVTRDYVLSDEDVVELHL